MIVDFIGRAVVVCMAYFIAVIAAAAFFVLVVFGTETIVQAQGEPLFAFVFRLTIAVGAVATMAGAIAAPPILAAIAVAEAFRLSGLAFHAAAGVALGALALIAWDDEGRSGQPEYIVAMASGAVGAFVYWLLAGRRAGLWRARLSRPAPPEA